MDNQMHMHRARVDPTNLLQALYQTVPSSGAWRITPMCSEFTRVEKCPACSWNFVVLSIQLHLQLDCLRVGGGLLPVLLVPLHVQSE